MIEIFKTDIQDKDAPLLLEVLSSSFPVFKFNFDLNDTDKILRVDTVEGTLEPDVIVKILKTYQYRCQVLEDEY
jgi:hypothetical protein